MTSLQRSMILSSLRAPRSGVYILQALFDLPEPLQVGRFKDAWRQVAERHSALRTSFVVDDDGEVRQRVQVCSDIPWEEIDWPGSVSEFLKADRELGFDFAAGIPMRFTMLGNVLVWTGHHALLDGRSYAILWRDVFACYEKSDSVDAEPYWREYLAGISQTTGYIVDRIHPAGAAGGQSFGEENFSLTEELTNALWSFAEQNGCTVNTLVLGAWALLLSRYSGRTDIVFGVTRSGRNSFVRDAVGLFINTVPFRVRVDGGGWLQRIRQDWMRGREYESTPLESVRAWSGLPAGMPMFDSVVVYDNQPLTDSVRKLGGLAQFCTLSGAQRADAPITVVAYGRPRLSVNMLYDANLFSRETMAGVAGHLRTLLTSFVTQPEPKMLTAAEEEWLVRGCNHTAAAFPPELCAHQLIEQQAHRTPGNIALEFPGGAIDYRELNERANRVAGALRAKGAGPEDLIAVRMDRTPEAVIALLGVLKAGAAFLPVDPALPEERLASIMEDAKPKLTLTNLDQLAAAMDDAPCTVAPANAAYAVYTSGSTGKPKGLVVTHRSLVNHTLAVRRVFDIVETDRRLQFAPMGTDVFVAEVFNYLSVGATLVMDPGRRSVQEFSRLLDERRITITAFTGTWFNEWVAALAAGALPMPSSLRAVIAGMEQTNPEAVLMWRRLAGRRVRWFNAYGPSETCPTSTIYEAGSSEYECAAYVPIGKPIANTQAYVLDAGMNLVPAGVVGELYIGGEGVSRGYLGAAELTAAKFPTDPFREGGRMYRTGDLAFRLPDGNLVFVGRTDRQVKIRGFRVELEEIEAVLGQHPAVRQCAVIADEQEQLRAYVCLRGGQAVGPEELRLHLAKRLAAHMLPATYTTLSEMPLTAGGKLDRKSLPLREPEPAVTPALMTDTERRLAALWRNALAVGEPAALDNFFECGGDSVRATRLITLIQREFGKEVAMSMLFRNPTLAGLASILESREQERSDPPNTTLALRTEGAFPPMFCISAGGDDAFRFSTLAERLDANQPLYALPVALLPTVEEMGQHMCRSIREIRPRGPYILGGYCFGGLVAFEAAQQFTAAGEDVRLLVLFDTPAPGYPKLLRSGAGYWRELRRGVQVREIAEHVGVVGRLLRKKAPFLALEQTADPRAHAAGLYSPKPIRVPVAQFIAADDAVSTRVLDDPRLGWRDVCMAGFEVRRISGSHPSLFLERVPQELVDGLAELLSKARKH